MWNDTTKTLVKEGYIQIRKDNIVVTEKGFKALEEVNKYGKSK